MILAEKIKEKADLKGLSIRSLEQKAGLKRGSIQNILYGLSKQPRTHTLQSIANALDCSLQELIGYQYYQQQTVENIEVRHNYMDKPFTNERLFCDVVHSLITALKEKDTQIPNHKFLLLLQEIYFYCLENDSDIADKQFINWAIKKAV